MSSKEDSVIVVDFSLVKLTTKDGIVVMKSKLCDVGGVFDLNAARKINDEVGKALEMLK